MKSYWKILLPNVFAYIFDAFIISTSVLGNDNIKIRNRRIKMSHFLISLSQRGHSDSKWILFYRPITSWRINDI